MFPVTPQRQALTDLLEEPEFGQKENPLGSQGGKLYLDRGMFPSELKEGDTVTVKATVGNIGSKVAIEPFEIVGDLKDKSSEGGDMPFSGAPARSTGGGDRSAQPTGNANNNY